MLSSLLPLPLECQNIPDGCIIPCYPQNIKFLAPNEPPTVSTPPDHCFWHCLHVFTSAPNPCTTAPPYYTPSPSHPAPSASQPLYLPTQKFLLLILTSPSTTARVFFFGWWGIPGVDWWSHSLILTSYQPTHNVHPGHHHPCPIRQVNRMSQNPPFPWPTTCLRRQV